MKNTMKRRRFIKTAAVGTAAVYLAPSFVLDSKKVFSAEVKSRVVMTSHSNIVDSSEQINSKVVRTAVDETLIALTNTTSIQDAWMHVFPRLQSTDVIGIKVNCINRQQSSHPEVVYAIAQSLTESVDVNPNNIIIWDRTSGELKKSRYTLNATDEGIRCFGTTSRYSLTKNWLLNLVPTDGVGYDENAVVDVGEGTRVHLSKILSETCNYLINVPVLKDHSLAGVTLSLKNHYGSIDRPGSCHGGLCNPYIANLNNASFIRDKTKLILCDALFGIYRGGPRGAPQWINRQLLASTDPVALDYAGMTLIDQQRRERNMALASERVKYLRTASKLGLGTDDPQQIDMEELQIG